jgi:hypothetical protein
VPIAVQQIWARLKGCRSSELVILCVCVSVSWRGEVLTGRWPGSCDISSDRGDTGRRGPRKLVHREEEVKERLKLGGSRSRGRRRTWWGVSAGWWGVSSPPWGRR